MSGIISAIGSLVTAAASWVATWVGTMFTSVTSGSTTTSELNIIGLFAIIPLVGLGIGLLKRLINVN